MKVVLFVALFAFLAVQVSLTAPVPEDEVKAEKPADKKDEGAELSAIVPAVENATPVAPAEGKAETAGVEVPKVETPVASPDEKKE